jgi:hypothetical protein
MHDARQVCGLIKVFNAHRVATQGELSAEYVATCRPRYTTLWVDDSD